MTYVYILRSFKPRKHRYYIGVTNNLIRRITEHNSPFNIGYTRGWQWEIVYMEGYSTPAEAYKRERQLKQYGNVWYGVMRRVRRSIG